MERTGFGKKLRELREAAKLTQEELAEKSGIYVHGIAKMERGVREPTWPTALRLAKAIGVGVGAFADGDEMATAEPAPKKRTGKAKAK